MRPAQRRVGGFTLVELVVVMGVLTVLATLTIPQLIRIRHNVNESVAVTTLHTYITELESYRAHETPPAFPSNLAALADADPEYLGSPLANDPATYHGYIFAYTQESANEYTLTATPEIPGLTGTREFTTDQTGVIYADGAPIS